MGLGRSRPRRNARPQVSPIAFPLQSRSDPGGVGRPAVNIWGRAQVVELPHVFSDVTVHCGEAHGLCGSPDPAETRATAGLPHRVPSAIAVRPGRGRETRAQRVTRRGPKVTTATEVSAESGGQELRELKCHSVLPPFFACLYLVRPAVPGLHHGQGSGILGPAEDPSDAQHTRTVVWPSCRDRSCAIEFGMVGGTGHLGGGRSTAAARGSGKQRLGVVEGGGCGSRFPSVEDGWCDVRGHGG